MSISPADSVLQAYAPLFELSPSDISIIGKQISIPQFEESFLIDICGHFREMLKRGGPLIELEPPITIVGDIHGNLLDLLRVFSKCGQPPNTKYLFLGDYVDRGPYSIEVITLLFALKLKYPTHIFLIRGNHEFQSVNSLYGLKEDCYETYGSFNVYLSINKAFSYLPFAALIQPKILCVHGGLSPQLHTIDQIKRISLPVLSDGDTLIRHLVWSDPCDTVYQYCESGRGAGVTFGSNVVDNFCDSASVDCIIRGHQCVKKGIEPFADGKMITVFTSSNYCGSSNSAAVLEIKTDLTRSIHKFKPLSQKVRSESQFYLYRPRIKPAHRMKIRTMSHPKFGLCMDLIQKTSSVVFDRSSARIRKHKSMGLTHLVGV